MKSLLIMRHAKAEIDSKDHTDFNRALADRGHKDAAVVTKRLMDEFIEVDLFITSTALRAKTTCEYFYNAYVKENPTKDTKMIELQDLYLAPKAVFYAVIEAITDNYQSIVIVAHNPGIEDFINSLQVAKLDAMPTCGIFGVQANINSWADFKTASKQFWLFDYPKSI